MRNCTHCVYANWRRTSNGRLHPSGDGRCAKEIKLPQLPNAWYWFGTSRPSSGYIHRKTEYDTDCPYGTIAPVTTRQEVGDE